MLCLHVFDLIYNSFPCETFLLMSFSSSISIIEFDRVLHLTTCRIPWKRNLSSGKENRGEEFSRIEKNFHLFHIGWRINGKILFVFRRLNRSFQLGRRCSRRWRIWRSRAHRDIRIHRFAIAGSTTSKIHLFIGLFTHLEENRCESMDREISNGKNKQTVRFGPFRRREQSDESSLVRFVMQ